MLKKIAIAALLLLLLIPALWLGFPYYTAKRVEVTVTDKERVPMGDQGSYYLVFTEDEVFQNVDSWRRFKVNSSDVQGGLRVGGTYVVSVYGWRIRMLSRYRNIVAIRSEVRPAVGAVAALPELEPRVEGVAGSGLPVAVLYSQTAHAADLREALEERFPELKVRVFGDGTAGPWGIMIYREETGEVVLEAAPLETGDFDGFPQWGPGTRGPD
ncbi:MAG: hypothetical protein JJU00_13670 [Opitutales bacterium]|nr:hypothetical protein [Opitutales bacterium]